MRNQRRRAAQRDYYLQEIETLKKGIPITKGNIKKYIPFVDRKGLLRVVRRLQGEDLSYDEKHPLILPPLEIPKTRSINEYKTCSITKQIIVDAHENLVAHGGLHKTAYMQYQSSIAFQMRFMLFNM
jgi:hypothetical protein